MMPWTARRERIRQGLGISNKLPPEAFGDVWMPRAKALAELVVGWRTPGQVVSLRLDLGWSEDLIRNVLAYAEGRTLEYRGGKWGRL